MSAFRSLWHEVRALTNLTVPFSPTFGPLANGPDIDLVLADGLDVALSDVEAVDGLLAVKGRQILLYIPDQGGRIGEVLAGDLGAGKKVHLANCETLDYMRESGRFDRYIATTKVTGLFHVTGSEYRSRRRLEGHSRLLVCMHCLSQLNYKGAKSSSRIRRAIRQDFDFAEYFECYSTVFPFRPRGTAVQPDAYDYPADWARISDGYRAEKNWTCETCLIVLSDHRQLLHTHHRNGNRGDCAKANLQALCADCHRRQPFHSRMHILHRDMAIIARKRLAMRQEFASWEVAIDRTDLALNGALQLARQNGWSVPRPGGVPGADDPIGVHWPDRRLALTLAEHASTSPHGWTSMSSSQFIARFG